MPSEPYEILFSDGRVVTDFSGRAGDQTAGAPLGRIWVFEDVTEQRRVARQLLHMAERDPLTNLTTVGVSMKSWRGCWSTAAAIGEMWPAGDRPGRLQAGERPLRPSGR